MTKRAMATATRVAGIKEGNGNSNEGGKAMARAATETTMATRWRATKRALARVARVIVMAIKRAMARVAIAMGMAIRIAGNKEGNVKRVAWVMAMATRMSDKG